MKSLNRGDDTEEGDLRLARFHTIKWGVLAFLLNKDVALFTKAGADLRTKLREVWKAQCENNDDIQKYLSDSTVKRVMELINPKYGEGKGSEPEPNEAPEPSETQKKGQGQKRKRREEKKPKQDSEEKVAKPSQTETGQDSKEKKAKLSETKTLVPTTSPTQANRWGVEEEQS